MSSKAGKWVRDNGLTLAFLGLLVLTLIGQSIAGVIHFNQQQIADGAQQISWLQYVTSSSFCVDVAENWQSEFLQFALYIVATVWLVQRGSSESKALDEAGSESDKEQKIGRYADDRSPRSAQVGGLRTALYGRSLGFVMAFFFFGSLAAQSIAGQAAYNHDQLSRYEDPVSWWTYVTGADFWDRALQNWQSEFLAVAAMAAFSIYLRYRGSPESKLVGAPHDATGLDSG
jgi:membrane protein implicated in regulation of membrane protease activity